MSTTTEPITVAQFLQMTEVEGEKTELINGQLTSMPKARGPHELVKARINEILVGWVLQTKSLTVWIESGYQVNDENYLIPDLSLTPRPGDPGLGDRAPELAIEVVSSESAARLEDKITLYLKYGSHAVWVIYPRQRAIHVRDEAGNARRLTESDKLEDPALLPGFSTPVSAIFESA